MKTATLRDWERVFLGALLHEVGKVWQRGEQDVSSFDYEALSAAVLDDLFADPLIYAAGAYHSEPKLERALAEGKLDGGRIVNLVRLIGEADKLASGELRPEPEYHVRPLQSIFGHVALVGEELSRSSLLQPLCRMSPTGQAFQFPRAEMDDELGADYERHWQAFYQALSSEVGGDRSTIDLTTIYYLCKKHLWCVPSAYYGISTDISLFEHSRLSAAISVCLYHFLCESEQGAEPAAWQLEAIQNRLEERYLLVCGDFNGIQRFIYDIAHRGALKALKGRSFLLQQILDHTAHLLLSKLSLSEANLLYSSGGKFYLLVPNTVRTHAALEELEVVVNKELLRLYGGENALLFATHPLRGQDFLPDDKDGSVPLSKAWDQLNKTLASEYKFRKFRSLLDESFFLVPEQERPYGAVERCYATGIELCAKGEIAQYVATEAEGGFQKVRRSGNPFYVLPEDEIAANMESRYLCEEQYLAQQLGRRLKSSSMIIDVAQSGSDCFPTIGGQYIRIKDSPLPGSRITLLNDDDVTSDRLRAYPCKAYQFYGGNWQLDEHLLKASGLEGSFEYWQQQATGMGYLAVLRMDVDNLGLVFKDGLGKDATISRIVQLSAMLDFFFSGYLNRLKDLYWSADAGLNEQAVGCPLAEALQIVYAGGDDLFIVGRWDVMPDVALWIRQTFKRYVGGNTALSISGGIAFFHAQQPLFKIAELAKEAEELAKGYMRANGKTKDAICFLGAPMDWEDFELVSKLAKEWYTFVKGDGENGKLPKSFLGTVEDIFASFVEAVWKNRLKSGNQEWPSPATMDREETTSALYGPWRWRAAYRIQRIGRQNKEYKGYMDKLAKDLFINQVSERDYLFLLNAAAKWADFLTREK